MIASNKHNGYAIKLKLTTNKKDKYIRTLKFKKCTNNF